MEYSATSLQSAGLEDPVQLFAMYPFATDSAYQEGLNSIMSNPSISSKSDQEKLALILRSKIFYFNQLTGSSLTEEGVLLRSGRVGDAPSAPLDSSLPSTAPAAEGRVLSFAELKDLIEQGKTDQIPNNEHIPDDLNESAPSESRADVPRKPWESDPETAVA